MFPCRIHEPLGCTGHKSKPNFIDVILFGQHVIFIKSKFKGILPKTSIMAFSILLALLKFNDGSDCLDILWGIVVDRFALFTKHCSLLTQGWILRLLVISRWTVISFLWYPIFIIFTLSNKFQQLKTFYIIPNPIFWNYVTKLINYSMFSR